MLSPIFCADLGPLRLGLRSIQTGEVSATSIRTMILPGFTSPNSTTLRRAVPFHDDMEKLLGKWSAAGEPVLWFGSVLSGIVFCKLVRFCPNCIHIV